MNLLKVVNPTYGLPSEHKTLASQMSIYAGSKRKAVELIKQAIVINSNGYDEKVKLEMIKKLADEKAYTPNAGERMLGMKRPALVSSLEKFLLQVKPLPETISKN